LQLLHLLLLFYFLNSSNNAFNCWSQNSICLNENLFIKPGKLWNLVIQIAHFFVVRYFYPRIIRHSFVFCTCICLLWLPFILHLNNYDEQIQAMLSFALTGGFIFLYQIYLHYHFDVKMDTYSKLVLCSAGVSYTTILCVYLYFPVSRPTDYFFANRGWCGISSEDPTKKNIHDSCTWVRES
jgi:hypothetical protein